MKQPCPYDDGQSYVSCWVVERLANPKDTDLISVFAPYSKIVLGVVPRSTWREMDRLGMISKGANTPPLKDKQK